MCNINEIPPTEKEKLKIVSGYKVFLDRLKDGKLQTPFFCYDVKEEWVTAHEPTISNERGFHVFIKRKDAVNYLDALTHGFAMRENLIIKKVLVKDIVAIGQTDRDCYGGPGCPPHSVLRCEQIKIFDPKNSPVKS
jgi:hypothetical protein